MSEEEQAQGITQIEIDLQKPGPDNEEGKMSPVSPVK